MHLAAVTVTGGRVAHVPQSTACLVSAANETSLKSYTRTYRSKPTNLHNIAGGGGSAVCGRDPLGSGGIVSGASRLRMRLEGSPGVLSTSRSASWVKSATRVCVGAVANGGESIEHSRC